MQARVRSDPRAFLEELQPRVLFDEIQNTPELLDYVRVEMRQEGPAPAAWGCIAYEKYKPLVNISQQSLLVSTLT
jgi:hypothetical protein